MRLVGLKPNTQEKVQLYFELKRLLADAYN